MAVPNISPTPWRLERLPSNCHDILDNRGVTLAALFSSEEDGRLMSIAPDLADIAGQLVAIECNEAAFCSYGDWRGALADTAMMLRKLIEEAV